MELIVIDESRIKLMLTAEDMAAYRIAESGTREALLGIMTDACRKCGYAGGVMRGRIYVEMYPSKKGGCELFVTRLAERAREKERESKNETERENAVIMKTGNESILAEYRKYIFRGRVIYAFEKMADLLCACLGLMKSGYGGESSAYCDEEKRVYYLILEQESHIASENLGTLCRSSVYYYINEHCRQLCTGHDAVATLGKLA